MAALGMFQGAQGPAINNNQEIPLALDLSHNNMRGTFPAWLVTAMVGAAQNVSVNLQVGLYMLCMIAVAMYAVTPICSEIKNSIE